MSRWVMVGASSSLMVEPWVTVCVVTPLSSAEALTVISPSSRYQVSAKAASGRLHTSSSAIIEDSILLGFIEIQTPFPVCGPRIGRAQARCEMVYSFTRSL